MPFFVNLLEHIPEHILKHFRKIFRLFIFGNFLLCNEAPPLIADSMLVLSEMFKTLLVVLFADKDGLTERSILHKTANKENLFTVVHFVLSRGQNSVLLCDRLSDQIYSRSYHLFVTKGLVFLFPALFKILWFFSGHGGYDHF